MKKVAISQLRYLPNMNYIQRVYLSDVFVLMDKTKLHRRDFEHRNKILTENGTEKMLTLQIASTKDTPAKDCVFRDGFSPNEHKEIIRRSYRKSKFYSDEILDKIYPVKFDGFFDFSKKMLMNITDMLEIHSQINTDDAEDDLRGVARLERICEQNDADAYISGSFGRNYIDEFRYDIFYHHSYGEDYKGKMSKLSIVDNIFRYGIKDVENSIKTEIDLRR